MSEFERAIIQNPEEKTVLPETQKPALQELIGSLPGRYRGAFFDRHLSIVPSANLLCMTNSLFLVQDFAQGFFPGDREKWWTVRGEETVRFLQSISQDVILKRGQVNAVLQAANQYLSGLISRQDIDSLYRSARQEGYSCKIIPSTEYVGGTFDWAGTLSIEIPRKGHFIPRMKLTSVHSGLLEGLKEKYPDSKINGQAWIVNPESVKKVLEDISSYIVIRKPLIDLFLEYSSKPEIWTTPEGLEYFKKIRTLEKAGYLGYYDSLLQRLNQTKKEGDK